MTEPDEASTAERPAAWRTVALAMTVIIGTALLLWGADWLARIGAESLLTRETQDATGTSARPSVRIHGFFFLPQVVRGRYNDVEISLTDVSSGPLRIHTVHARLTGVHLPFHDVLVRKAGEIVIDQADEEALVTYDDLNRYLSLAGHHVTMKPTADGQVQITGSAQVLGKTVAASADARITSEQGALAVHPIRLHTNTSLDRASEILLGQRFTLQIPLDPLPFGQQITSIAAAGSGLIVHARGSNIVVAP